MYEFAREHIAIVKLFAKSIVSCGKTVETCDPDLKMGIGEALIHRHEVKISHELIAAHLLA